MSQHVPPLTWMHGTGNRFALVEWSDLAGVDPAELVIRLAGGSHDVDGLLVIEQVDGDAELCMHVFNSDGSSAAMCGNGLRCVAFDAYRRGMVRGRTIRIRVGDFILAARVLGIDGDEAMVCTQMPVPRVEESQGVIRVHLGNNHGVLLQERLPDASRWKEQVKSLQGDGLLDFNLHAVSIVSRTEIEMRSWERGAGPTLACASGATAVVGALASRSMIDTTVIVNQPGGQLRVSWNGHLRRPMTFGKVACMAPRKTTSDSMAGMT